MEDLIRKSTTVAALESKKKGFEDCVTSVEVKINKAWNEAIDACIEEINAKGTREKAMLIMDMPNACLDCPCSKFNPNIKKECHWECEANGMELDEINLDIERPIWCPLHRVVTEIVIDNYRDLLERTFKPTCESRY